MMLSRLCLETMFRMSGGFRGPPGASGGLGASLQTLRPPLVGLVVGPAGLQGPPGASGGLRPPSTFEAGCWVWWWGFASYLGCSPGRPSNISISRLPGEACPLAPRATPGRPPRPRLLGLGFLNNLVNHRKGEGVP